MEGIKLPTSRDFRLKMDKVSDSILQNQENDDDTNAAEDTAEDEVKTWFSTASMRALRSC